MGYPLVKEFEEEYVLELESLEQGGVDDQITSDEEEEVEVVDPDYLYYLRETYIELYGYVEAAGGELIMSLYTRRLLDELYIWRHVSPYWFNLGLDLIYED